MSGIIFAEKCNMFRIMTISLLLPLFCIITSTLNYSDSIAFSGIEHKSPPFINAETEWVDSVMNSLSLDEKIGQLLMYPAYSNKGGRHTDYIKSLITDYNIGGLIFMQGNPEDQVKLINEYQQTGKIPLLIAMDAEWSLSMRLQNTVLYPRQMMLGAIQDNYLIYNMGVEFARQLKRVGVHINFAPVADVNNNPLNPVINCRSFGEDIINVSKKSYYYMKGLQDNGILAVGKHFPGHGDTDTDSHYSLPKISHDRARLDSVELYPFRYLIKRGLGGIMTAHLFVPAIDSLDNMPTSLSPNAINGLLKAESGFKGLIFTDALNMGGITNHFKPGEADVMALIAGNDILVFANDARTVIKKIKNAVKKGLITEEAIDEKCRKVLMVKYWSGLDVRPQINSENITEELNSPRAELMQQKLIENAITVVKNDKNLLPVKGLDTLKIASIKFGSRDLSVFQNRMNYYADLDHFIYSKDVSEFGRKGLLDTLSSYDIVIASIHSTNRNPSSRFGISQSTINFIDDLSNQANIILNIFGNPYSLDYFKNARDIETIVISYNDWEITNDLSAQLIFGGIAAKGRLPVSPNEYFPVGSGVDTEKIRLKYSKFPEEVKVNREILKKIDSLLLDGLEEKAYPGARVMIARNGVVFYNKSIGYHTDKKDNPVNDFAIYDLASLTKVLSTTATIMRLYEQDKILLDDKISEYIPGLDTTDKKDINFRDILTHQSGLISWIPFYAETITDDSIFNAVYSSVQDDLFNIKVAENMYMHRSYLDTIYHRIFDSRIINRKRYLYSDVGFYILKDIIENITDTCFNDYVYNNFYNSLGANSLRYNPLNYFEKDIIVPTEIDKIFRKQLLHGYVHDYAAAMFGGIAGHAGLFGNANDVLKLMQMFLNNGEYGEERYFSEETVRLFTDYYDRSFSRRSLGFDKPEPNNNGNGIGGNYASKLSYGHLGFTGTMVWTDPEYDFVYVFLSNRVYPSANNRKLNSMRIRGNILDVIYEAIDEY